MVENLYNDEKNYSLGIDTSNYKTSLAVVDKHKNIISNMQKYLQVRKGERGLRQSDALFQHVKNIPVLVQDLFDTNPGIRDKIGIVAASSTPRPVEGSYMPVFNGGISAGKILASVIGCPVVFFSHQEGHIEAVKAYSTLEDSQRFISFHFSGGTTEAILADNGEFSIVGGTKDISYGQVLDRVGVSMGLDFPCGEVMDRIAQNVMPYVVDNKNPLSKIKVIDGLINLSGIETGCQREIGNVKNDMLIYFLFQRIGESIVSMVEELGHIHQIDKFIFAGGVSSSQFIRNHIENRLTGNFQFVFGDPALSTDNAVGIALLGGKKLWH